MMKPTLAFDVYGTLIDTHGLVSRLRETAGEKAEEFSRIWRQKQLEYSFRRGLMQNYEPFAVCTRNALDYACAYCRVPLIGVQKEELLDSYRKLPAFGDVEEGLKTLNASGFRIYAFSNGSAEAVEALLAAAGIREHFLDVVSVDDLKSFKPNPAVYSYFLRKSDAIGASAWLISGNPFDVIGAVSAGMRAVWVKRFPETIFDPWEIEPTLTVSGLGELDSSISAFLSKE